MAFRRAPRVLLAANGLTIVNVSFVGRNFMTAIADRREAEFVRQAIFYVGVGEGAVDIQSDDAHAASVSAPKRGTGGSRDPADKGPPCH